jgi:Outer membrane protein beta-barrel domain
MIFKVYPRHIHILTILVILIPGFARQAYSQKFTVGVKAGATLSISSFGDNDDKNEFTNLWKPGYFAAGLINFPLKKSFSFQTEIGFSQRGRKIEFNEGTWDNNATYHFLDASMLLRKSYPLKWSRNVRGTWFFNVGPKVSYWLNGKGIVTTGGVFVDPDDGLTKISKGGAYDYKIKFSQAPEIPDAPDFNTMYMSDENRWLFGLDFGLGVDAPTTSLQRFVFEVRFTSGHTFYGGKGSAFNRTLGFSDNLRANEKIISFSIDYTLSKELHEGLKGKSTNKDVKKGKPRKNFDSAIH